MPLRPTHQRQLTSGIKVPTRTKWFASLIISNDSGLTNSPLFFRSWYATRMDWYPQRAVLTVFQHTTCTIGTSGNVDLTEASSNNARWVKSLRVFWSGPLTLKTTYSISRCSKEKEKDIHMPFNSSCRLRLIDFLPLFLWPRINRHASTCSCIQFFHIAIPIDGSIIIRTNPIFEIFVVLFACFMGLGGCLCTTWCRKRIETECCEWGIYDMLRGIL